MSFSISSNPESTRNLDPAGPALQKMMDLNLRSRVSKVYRDLPLEVWEIIAEYLPASDLHHFSDVSIKCKVAALKQKNIQEMQQGVLEIAYLAEFKPSENTRFHSPAIQMHQEVLKDHHDRPTLRDFPGLNIKPDAEREFQLKLTAFSAQNIAQEYIDLSHLCFEQIQANQATMESIQQTYLSKTSAFVTQAVCHLIESTIDPKLSRGLAVTNAARNGLVDVVRNLLSHGDIDRDDRDNAVQTAGDKGYLDVLQVLLENQDISSEERQGLAVWRAAQKGCPEAVRDCLKNGPISDRFKGWIVEEIAKNGQATILKVLLASISISCADKGRAAYYAAGKGHLLIVQALLESESIDDSHRQLAIKEAAKQGHLEIVKVLLAAGPMDDCKTRASVEEASRCGHLEIVQFFLSYKEVSEATRGDAFLAAVIKRDLRIVKILLENGPIQQFHRKLAVIEAVNNPHLEIIQLLHANRSFTETEISYALNLAKGKPNQEIYSFFKGLSNLD